MTSRRKRNLILLAKWACYFLILLIAATLQSLPGFLSIFGVRPLFILPVCLAVAIYEGEYPGALLAVAGGFLWDWTASRMFSPVRTPGPTTMGGRPRSRVNAFSIMKFSGGTTLQRMAPVTSV